MATGKATKRQEHSAHMPDAVEMARNIFAAGLNRIAAMWPCSPGTIEEIRYDTLTQLSHALDKADRLSAFAPAMLAWLEDNYAAEEGPGETDRPRYIELRALLAKICNRRGELGE